MKINPGEMTFRRKPDEDWLPKTRCRQSGSEIWRHGSFFFPLFYSQPHPFLHLLLQFFLSVNPFRHVQALEMVSELSHLPSGENPSHQLRLFMGHWRHCRPIYYSIRRQKPSSSNLCEHQSLRFVFVSYCNLMRLSFLIPSLSWWFFFNSSEFSCSHEFLLFLACFRLDFSWRDGLFCFLVFAIRWWRICYFAIWFSVEAFSDSLVLIEIPLMSSLKLPQVSEISAL